MANQEYITINYPGHSYAQVPCLEFLWGAKWDDIAKAWLRSLRPSSIRVCYGGGETCDARVWRVTVHVREDGRISCIHQEVEVDLPEGIENGHDLTCKSPDPAEPKWR